MLKRSALARRLPLAPLVALSLAYLGSCGDYLPPGDEITGGPGSEGQVNLDALANASGGTTAAPGGEGGEGGESLPGNSGTGGQADGGLGGAGGVAVMTSPCETCANSMCRCDGFSAEPGRGHLYNLCNEGLLNAEGKPDKAIEGRRLGALRSDLCKAVVDCARRTGCAKGELVDPVNKIVSDEQFCYCGKVTDMQCLSGKAAGACLKEIEDAAESVLPEEITPRLRDDNFALGRAINYLRVCDNVICSAKCGVPVFETNPIPACPVGGASGPGGTGGAGGLSSMSGGSTGSGGAASSSGGVGGMASGGSSGSGGGGPSGSGGSSGSGSGGSSGSGGMSVGTSAKCLACEAASCNATEAGCSLFEGTRKAGCEAWVACIRTPRETSCVGLKDGVADVQKCYCGTATDSKCLSGLANGVCRAEAERAAELAPCTAEETSSGTCAERQATDVAVRFRDPAYPIGPGSNLLYCDFESCNPVCTVPTSDPPPGGTGGVSGTGGGTGGVSGTGGTTGTGGTSTGGTTGTGSTPASGGTGGTVTTGVVLNPDFDIDTSAWAAESSVVLLFNAEDSEARIGSGSVDVTNTVFQANLNSISWAGGAQCVAVQPDTTYALTAKAKVPSDRPTGSAGVDVRFFASPAGCEGTPEFGNPRFTTTPNGAWKDLTVSAKTPADARYMLVRLLAVKAIYEPSLNVRFDKIRLTK